MNRMSYVSKFNQRKTTQSFINWLNNIEKKQKHRLFNFVVKVFYPSISRNTVQEALALIKNYCAVSKEEIDNSSSLL